VTLRLLNGIDLVRVGRFRELDAAIRARFYQRVFTEEERAYIGDSFEKAAGIFAAKEAAVKALGCGIGIVTWQDVRVRHDGEGKPALELVGEAQETARALGVLDFSLSISHTREFAAASAVALADMEGSNPLS